MYLKMIIIENKGIDILLYLFSEGISNKFRNTFGARNKK
jgi:hypothetical protein